MHIHCFQHARYESPGNILEWANGKGHSFSFTRFYENIPDYSGLKAANLLLIMGGAMNVDEEEKYPWLHKEKQLIREYIANKGKVIGICLGAQLIASALGAKVYPAAHKEIGFLPVHFTETAAASELFNVFPKQLTVFHWHGDTFDLPPQATLMASSTGVINQAFVIDNRIAGFQFHPEATNTTVQGMLQNDGHELKNTGAYIQSKEQLLQSLKEQNGKVQTSFFKFLDQFTSNKPQVMQEIA